MVSDSVDVRDFTKDDAKKYALGFIQEIIDFANVIENKNPGAGFLAPIVQLTELQSRVGSGRPPIRQERDVDWYFEAILKKLIDFRPAVSKQLRQFFEVHREITSLSNGEDGPIYNPTSIIEDRKPDIISVTEKYRAVTDQFMKAPNDPMTIYALLFIHILNTETLADGMIGQLKKILQDFNLTSKYDAAAIYSVDQHFKLKNGTITDGQAIRHCLAHNLFEIEFRAQDWQIHFNNDKAAEYKFQKAYSADQFSQFLKNSSYLYRASYIILNRIIAGTIVKVHFVEK